MIYTTIIMRFLLYQQENIDLFFFFERDRKQDSKQGYIIFFRKFSI